MSRSFSEDYENNLIAIKDLRFMQVLDIIVAALPMMSAVRKASSIFGGCHPFP
jgi:hypothetical protein